jgi:DNA-binding MarR family transcriptional regulator
MAGLRQLNRAGNLIWWITIIKYNLKGGAGPRALVLEPGGIAGRAMTVSKTATAESAKESVKDGVKESFRDSARKEQADGAMDGALQMGELSELLGYSLKRAQLKIFEDFLRCVAPLQLTPAQFSVLLLLDRNPGRNQTEIANTLGILRPNFVAMLDALESRDLCTRMRSSNDRRSHILVLTEKGKAVLARAKKLVASKHEARLNELLGPANRAALLSMLTKIAQEF